MSPQGCSRDLARIRTIKPAFYEDDELAERSIWARFIFPALWMLSDRDGKLEDRPKRIKAFALPYDDQDIEALLTELHEHGFIVRYEVDGERYIKVLKFQEHQRITGKEAETPSKYPDPPTSETPGKQPGNTGEAVEMTGRERKGKEEITLVRDESPDRESGSYSPPAREGRAEDSQEGPRLVDPSEGRAGVESALRAITRRRMMPAGGC